MASDSPETPAGKPYGGSLGEQPSAPTVRAKSESVPVAGAGQELIKLLLPAVFSACAAGAVGWFFSGRFEQRLKEQEFRLANIKEMQEPIKLLTADRPTLDQARQAGTTLGVYGSPAVGPLISLLQLPSEYSRVGAFLGIGAVGLTEPEAVCAPLARVIQSMNQSFGWTTVRDAIRLAGTLRCRHSDLDGALDAAASALAGLDQLRAAVSEDPPVTATALNELRSALDSTRRRLAR